MVERRKISLNRHSIAQGFVTGRGGPFKPSIALRWGCSIPGQPSKEIHSRLVTSDLAASAGFVHDYPSKRSKIEREQKGDPGKRSQIVTLLFDRF
jgi:hypothetical protein